MHYFETMNRDILDNLDPSGGTLALAVSWRPQPEDPLPHFPGQKVSTLVYMLEKTGDLCLCGSGKNFGSCCQLLPYWRPISPKPGMHGHELLHSQTTLFTNVPDSKIYAFLEDDERVHCFEDTPQNASWVYWGSPALESSTAGIYCFGDIMLSKERNLLISTLNDASTQVILELLRPLKLGTPQIKKDTPPQVEKPTPKLPQSKPSQSKRRGK